MCVCVCERERERERERVSLPVCVYIHHVQSLHIKAEESLYGISYTVHSILPANKVNNKKNWSPNTREGSIFTPRPATVPAPSKGNTHTKKTNKGKTKPGVQTHGRDPF